jgi:hypothetical protein
MRERPGREEGRESRYEREASERVASGHEAHQVDGVLFHAPVRLRPPRTLEPHPHARPRPKPVSTSGGGGGAGKGVGVGVVGAAGGRGGLAVGGVGGVSMGGGGGGRHVHVVGVRRELRDLYMARCQEKKEGGAVREGAAGGGKGRGRGYMYLAHCAGPHALPVQHRVPERRRRR